MIRNILFLSLLLFSAYKLYKYVTVNNSNNVVFERKRIRKITELKLGALPPAKHNNHYDETDPWN